MPWLECTRILCNRGKLWKNKRVSESHAWEEENVERVRREEFEFTCLEDESRVRGSVDVERSTAHVEWSGSLQEGVCTTGRLLSLERSPLTICDVRRGHHRGRERIRSPCGILRFEQRRQTSSMRRGHTRPRNHGKSLTCNDQNVHHQYKILISHDISLQCQKTDSCN